MISTRQRKRFICVAGLIYLVYFVYLVYLVNLVCLVYLVCFVYLVCLVYLVYLVRFVENWVCRRWYRRRYLRYREVFSSFLPFHSSSGVDSSSIHSRFGRYQPG